MHAIEKSSQELLAENLLLRAKISELEKKQQSAADTLGDSKIQNTINRITEEALAESVSKFRTIFMHSPIGIALLDENQIVRVNPSFARILGKDDTAFFEGKNPADFLAAKIINSWRSIWPASQSRRFPAENLEVRLRRADGKIIWSHLWLSRLQGQSPDPGYLLVMVQDITEHKKAQEEIKKRLAEKQILLQEIHHRVKNNLQIIMGFIQLQSLSSSCNEETGSFLENLQNRIYSMALIHEKISQSENLANVNLFTYVDSLVRELFTSFAADEKQISWQVNIPPKAELNMATLMPLSIILNEVISNSLKYAFCQGQPGKISISYSREGNRQKITVADSGPGFSRPPSSAEGLGIKLVSRLAGQINGSCTFRSEQGTVFTLEFSE